MYRCWGGDLGALRQVGGAAQWGEGCLGQEGDRGGGVGGADEARGAFWGELGG